MSDDAELQEYFSLVKSVANFDQRLLTVKSWGVTLSLVALGLGFQYQMSGHTTPRGARSKLSIGLLAPAMRNIP